MQRYFYRWWVEQTEATQEQVRRLFVAGQLEFVNGGWCMADDASPSTDGWIDQVTLGHRYIYDVLNGTIPKYESGFALIPSVLCLCTPEIHYVVWPYHHSAHNTMVRTHVDLDCNTS